MATLDSDKLKSKLKLKKKPGKKRRIAGWTLLLLGLLVAGVWVGSRWFYCWCGSNEPRFSAGIAMGVFSCDSGRAMSNPGAGLRAFSTPQPRTYWFGWGVRYMPYNGVGFSARELGIIYTYRMIGGPVREFKLTLWPIPLLLWTPAALLLRSGYLARRRAKTGQCARCGYSLAGLGEGAACPECGARKT